MLAKSSKKIMLPLCLAITLLLTNYAYAAPELPRIIVTPYSFDKAPILTVNSPINGSYTGRVMLNYTIEKPQVWFNSQHRVYINKAPEQRLTSLTYVLDGKSTVISLNSTLVLPCRGAVELTNLTEGKHQLTVSVNASGVYRSFRGYFAETKAADSIRTNIEFTYIPPPTASPKDGSTYDTIYEVHVLGITLTLAVLIIGLVIVRKELKKRDPNG